MSEPTDDAVHMSQVALVRLEGKVDSLSQKIDQVMSQLLQAIAFGDRENASRIDAATAMTNVVKEDLIKLETKVDKAFETRDSNIQANRRMIYAGLFALAVNVVGGLSLFLITGPK